MCVRVDVGMCRQIPSAPKSVPSKTGKNRPGGNKKRKKMDVGDVGTEIHDAQPPAKKGTKKGAGVGSFAAKFKIPGQKPVDVWKSKYEGLLKAHGWGGAGGKKWPKTWPDREIATKELLAILGQQMLQHLKDKHGVSHVNAVQEAGGGTAAGGGGGDVGMHSMAVEEEQHGTGQQDGHSEEDEAGDDFEDEDEEGEDGGEGDEDDEGSVLGEGQGEDGEDGREGKDDDQYEQAAPDPSGVAFLLN